MQKCLSILGVCAALVMCCVSGAMNFLFLFSLGKTPLEAYVLGAASAAADVLKALLPFFIAWSWRDGRIFAVVTGSLSFILFAGFSLLSAIGFAADNRGVLVDVRENINEAYERVQRDLAQAELKRSALPSHRPASVVEEVIGSHQQNMRWSRTKACANATEPESLSYCETYYALRTELAAANEAKRLSDEIASLQAARGATLVNGAGQVADPQVAIISGIFKQEHESVRLALVILVAVLVEVGSSLGLFLASGHRVHKVGAVNIAKNNPLLPTGSVEEFCLEALQANRAGAIDVVALYDGYRSWCVAARFQAMSSSDFNESFACLAQQAGIVRVGNLYRGIGLNEDVMGAREAA